jgi:hypothetical protein
MISTPPPDWYKPKIKPCFHQISLDCLEKLVKCIERFNKGEIDAVTSCQIEKQILTDEIQDPEFLEFAVENISKLFGYLDTGRVNIRICRDITGEIWFYVDKKQKHDSRV